MNWFRNMNATPRLMSCFAAILLLTVGISYLSISSLSSGNARLGALYQEDMLGAMRVNDIAVARAMTGRSVRDAMLHIKEPAVVAEDERVSFTQIANMQSDIEAAEKGARSAESQEVLAIMHNALPAYERGHHEIYDRVKANDLAGAQALLLSVTAESKPLVDAAARAIEIKQRHAEEKFQTNNAAYQSSRATMISAAVLSLLLGVILSILIARSFSVPLGAAVETLEKVAEGDLTASLDVDTQDEVGHMAKALNRAVERLNATMRDVADSAANASSSSQQLAAASESIASGAQEQAASLEETSASLEEITATVRQTSENAQQASQLAVASKDAAVQGQDVVAQAIAAMSEINASSTKIADIISTIDEIAFQTNLLAVNAAVEAARAGDEGRGFAVVASEVRALAQRSAGAAKEIKVLIQDSLRKVDAGSALVNRSGETLHGIVGSVKRVTDIVGEMAVAASEQSAGVEQVNTAMTQMDQVTQSNSAQTEELSATAESLSEQAGHLLELVSTFNLDNGRKNPGSRHSDSYQAATAAAQPGVGARQSVKAVKSSSTALSKGNGLDRPGKAASRPSSPAFAASVPTGSDASFQEF